MISGPRLHSWLPAVVNEAAYGETFESIPSLVQRDLPGYLIGLTLVNSDSNLIINSVAGNRADILLGMVLPPSAGLAALSLTSGEFAWAPEYARVSAPTYLHMAMEEYEGIRSAATWPLCFAGQPFGILFAGSREAGQFADRELSRLHEVASIVGPLIGLRVHFERKEHEALKTSRQAFEATLHDDVIGPMFIVQAIVQRLRSELGTSVAAHSGLDHIESITSTLVSNLRDRLSPHLLESQGTLFDALELISSRYTAITNQNVEILSHGYPPDGLDAEISNLIVSVVREGLMNVIKHAGGTSVILSLSFWHNSVELSIQDGGDGVSEHSLSLSERSPNGERFGLVTLVQRVQAQGGTLRLRRGEEGRGANLYLHLPLSVGTS